MNARPRVLIIENSRQVTGALKSIVAMASELSDEFEFIFVMPDQPAIEWVRNRGFVAHAIPMVELSKNASAVVFYLPILVVNSIRVRSLVRRETIAIIHSNDLYNLIGPTMRWLGSRTPYVCHVRFLRQAFPGRLFDFWANRQLAAARYVVAVSEILKSQLPTSEHVRLIHDRVMAHEQQPARRREGAAERTLLYLSNVIPGKGHDTAIEAFHLLAREYPGWKLRFVGSDMGLEKNKDYRSLLQQRVRGYSLEQRVEWIDFTDDVEREYKNADITLNFSELESFSMTCLEAQFFGCPVIATRSGGPNEIIEDGRSGILVATKNVGEAVAALRTLMSDESRREQMGEAGARVARQKFGPLQTTERLRQLYRSLL